eukprot:TRINITY_DN10752_c0_g1_i1.p1 TRINITY_DN10752_c0_g1~~TRINITY_DN10752_c0_g1_i1.p1  ORF type:complete len:170 (-),score=47.88 TRINITY_DN10752_c0_g1_i1:153-662(-)
MEEESRENRDNLNLLLKYDQNKESFHFVEHGIVRAREADRKRRQDDGDDDVKFDELKQKLIVNSKIMLTGKKRRRDANAEDLFKESKEMRGPTEKRKSQIHLVKESGDTFKPKGATGGDVKIPTRPEPYAFIQLNPKALNKRYQNKASKVFETLMPRKKGTLAGIKKSD